MDDPLDLAEIRMFLNEIPSTVTVLNFNMTELRESYKYDYLIAATQHTTPQLVCFCTGNGINDDWIVSSTILYKVPLSPDNEEVHRIEMTEMGGFNVPTEVLTKMLEHGIDVCLDLGDGIYIYRDSEDHLLIGTANSIESIVIPDLPVMKYDGIYIRERILKERPHILEYDRYKVKVGPGTQVTISHDDISIDG